MALTLGNPDTIGTNTRNAMGDAIDDRVNGGGGAGTLALIDSSGPTDLAVFTLSATAFGAAASGVITLAGTPLSTTAAAGSETTPDEWELRRNGGEVVASGPVTGTGAITSGETVNLNSFSITVPAS